MLYCFTDAIYLKSFYMSSSSHLRHLISEVFYKFLIKINIKRIEYNWDFPVSFKTFQMTFHCIYYINCTSLNRTFLALDILIYMVKNI